MSTNFDSVGYLGFDTYGTVVDWRSGIARASEPFLHKHAIALDPYDFADQWRALYQPSMEKIRQGERNWVKLDVLNRESLETVLNNNGIDANQIEDAELNDLNEAWNRLDPWPDSVEGLTRLKKKFAIGPLSNGHIAWMLALERFGGLPWDVITGAELSKSYKPQAQTYLKSAEAVGFLPGQVALVAAHNSDLEAARSAGLRTVFVRRPHEHGPHQTEDLKAEQDWDIVVESLVEAADALGCE
ncbi:MULTISPECIES: haloacid dehalogenase type II [Acetobacteraceae]|uniref:Haloacid dehalogenase type II n=1 Tax=Komagataeibacter xylinus TaxID=28448 RepID=A0A857FTD7_KOMXY|nr:MULTISPECIES: haloacid dehalogenase type II [Acetobacteraceae]MBS0964424.1 haloacid dehalogenase type II [Acetobacter persici]QHC37658.1 haloacid dehalogenase type II [Komagataeibacter xylinus]